MTKERYAQLRNRPNTLFLYYIERGGILQYEKDFRNLLNKWLLLNYGMSLRAGGTIIMKYLDQKYQYKK